ncbi:hypothetical protein [Paenibacillus sp. GM2FR]|nr:hypothetical protein [Paenibacillus sp. GM2FR]
MWRRGSFELLKLSARQGNPKGIKRLDGLVELHHWRYAKTPSMVKKDVN